MNRPLLDDEIVTREVLKMHFKESARTITASRGNEDKK